MHYIPRHLNKLANTERAMAQTSGVIPANTDNVKKAKSTSKRKPKR